MQSSAARSAMNRAGPRFIASKTAGTTAFTAIDLGTYMGAHLYFAARTATVHINFGPTSAVSAATTAMFPIAAGTAQEFLVTEASRWMRARGATTATLGYGLVSR
jgi:hypothetical protein